MLQTNELTVTALRCKNECWDKYIKLISKIKAYFFMNAMFEDNGPGRGGGGHLGIFLVGMCCRGLKKNSPKIDTPF